MVQVGAPDQTGREAILRIHTRRIPLAPETDLRQAAAMTPGMTGADLANLANEAALLAVARHRANIGPAEFSAALEKIQLGAERTVLIPEEDRGRTAYRERLDAPAAALMEHESLDEADAYRAAGVPRQEF